MLLYFKTVRDLHNLPSMSPLSLSCRVDNNIVDMFPRSYGLPVEDGCPCDGEGHHHDEVGEEGEGAEHEVGHPTKPSLDHLPKIEDDNKLECV